MSTCFRLPIASTTHPSSVSVAENSPERLIRPTDPDALPFLDVFDSPLNMDIPAQAGASLESLAKGAVLFSRRFTVQELQDRWNCLLYDPLVSAEASGWMTEIERSKENKCFSEKRKFDSVRQQYYAMRKRIHNEPLDSMDIV